MYKSTLSVSLESCHNIIDYYDIPPMMFRDNLPSPAVSAELIDSLCIEG